MNGALFFFTLADQNHTTLKKHWFDVFSNQHTFKTHSNIIINIKINTSVNNPLLILFLLLNF
jgi:hypothetical protein